MIEPRNAVWPGRGTVPYGCGSIYWSLMMTAICRIKSIGRYSGRADSLARGPAALILLLLAWLLLAGCQAGIEQGGFAASAWRYHVPLRVVERTRTTVRNFPVSFELDTAALTAAGKMRSDAGDLRITIAGQETPIQLALAGADKTTVTFQIDLARRQVRQDVVLHYGNPSASPPEYDTSWGIISPTKDAFENELLKVSYGLKTSTFGKQWGCQKEFTIKWHDEDQFGGEKIPESWAKSRNDVTYWLPVAPDGPKFEVEVDGPIYKRVRFFSAERTRQHHPGAKIEHLKDLSQTITFYRNCPFILEDFRGIDSAVTTTAVPGGMRLRTRQGKRNFDFVARNLDSDQITWDAEESRAGFTASRERAEKEPHYRYLGDHAYNDYLILGVVNVHNGRGIGTCVKSPKTAFFVDWSHQRAGFSLWPQKRGRRMTRYLYYVENGRREVLSRGKILAAPPAVTLIEEPLAKTGHWGRIRIYRDSVNQLNVLLENSKIRVRYETRDAGDVQTYIREFVIKDVGESQGHWLDSAAHRRGLRSAEIVADTPEAKTVRLTWDGSEKFPKDAISQVTIYRDSPVLKIDYLQSAFAHICDLGTPGGTRKGNKYVIHGAEQWRQVRKEIDRPELRDHPSEDHRLTDDLFPLYPKPIIDRGWGPTPMNYKGWYIMGAYNPANGRGFGRVVPANAMLYMKLLAGPKIRVGTGFEFFPWWKMRGRSRRQYTSYLFAVTGGEKEILTVGKRIADRAGSQFAPAVKKAAK